MHIKEKFFFFFKGENQEVTTIVAKLFMISWYGSKITCYLVQFIFI